MTYHRILLVDPYKNLVNPYRMILEEESYSVETALTIEEAFHRISTQRYSAILTECFLPVEDTCLFIDRVKKESPETYVILVTRTVIDEATYEKLFLLGLDDLLVKPYSPEKILVHIRKGMRHRDFIVRKQQVESQFLEPIYFKTSLLQEFKRAKRHHRRFSLLILEVPAKERTGDSIDGFYLELAKILRRRVRGEDVLGRENGHFGILLPETDQAGSQAFTKRLLHLMQNDPAFQSDLLKPFARTVSIQSFSYPDQFAIPESLRIFLQGTPGNV